MRVYGIAANIAKLPELLGAHAGTLTMIAAAPFGLPG
jgi:hypothetical protein